MNEVIIIDIIERYMGRRNIQNRKFDQYLSKSMPVSAARCGEPIAGDWRGGGCGV